MKFMERGRTKIAWLQKRVAKGKFKSAEKIGAAAAAILAPNHGHRTGRSYRSGRRSLVGCSSETVLEKPE
jgi:hypothetical protein